MVKHFQLLFLLGLMFMSWKCDINALEKEDKINLLRAPILETYDSSKLAVADFLEDYFNIMHDSSIQVRNNYWDSKLFYSIQDNILSSLGNKEYFLENPPTILGIRNQGEYYYLKVLFEVKKIPTTILTLKVTKDPFNQFYFIDRISENLENYTFYKVKGYEFYYSPKTERNLNSELKAIKFSRKMAKLFDRPEKKLRIIVTKDYEDYAELLGYDYFQNTNLDINTGGLSVPYENLFYSQNGSSFYPHEIVHCYSELQDSFNWFDEGLASYLGGAAGYPLEFHLNVLAEVKDHLNFSDIPNNDKLIGKTTTFRYAIGGLFIKLAYERHGGNEAIFKLMNYGNKEENFHEALKDVFGLERKDYDTFIRTELRKYKTIEN